MFLRKAIKSFGLFVLVFCISISVGNGVISAEAASNDSEIRLDDKDTDTIQPSQTYVIKLNPDGDSWKIDELSINVTSSVSDKWVWVSNTTGGGMFDGDIFAKTDYHYLVSFWVNGINVTPKGNFVINGWRMMSARSREIFTWKEEDFHKDVEVKIQKIKCDKVVTTKEPSCTTDGYTQTTCKICGHASSFEIIKAGHTYVTKQVNYPTVYNVGTMDLYCTKCGNESTSEIPQYEFNVSIGGSQLKAIKLGHNLLFADTHKEAKYIPFVVPNGESVFDKQHS